MNLAGILCGFSIRLLLQSGEDDCHCKGIKLYGRVELVDSFEDLRIKVVDAYPELDVTLVDEYADGCGEWEIVDSHAGFKVKLVDDHPDLRVRFSAAYPGLK